MSSKYQIKCKKSSIARNLVKHLRNRSILFLAIINFTAASIHIIDDSNLDWCEQSFWFLNGARSITLRYTREHIINTDTSFYGGSNYSNSSRNAKNSIKYWIPITAETYWYELLGKKIRAYFKRFISFNGLVLCDVKKI